MTPAQREVKRLQELRRIIQEECDALLLKKERLKEEVVHLVHDNVNLVHDSMQYYVNDGQAVDAINEALEAVIDDSLCNSSSQFGGKANNAIEKPISDTIGGSMLLITAENSDIKQLHVDNAGDGIGDGSVDTKTTPEASTNFDNNLNNTSYDRTVSSISSIKKQLLSYDPQHDSSSLWTCNEDIPTATVNDALKDKYVTEANSLFNNTADGDVNVDATRTHKDAWTQLSAWGLRGLLGFPLSGERNGIESARADINQHDAADTNQHDRADTNQHDGADTNQHEGADINQHVGGTDEEHCYSNLDSISALIMAYKVLYCGYTSWQNNNREKAQKL